MPTPEETARRILEIFAEKNIPAGQIIMRGDLSKTFLESGGDAADLDAGIQYTLEHKWIEEDGLSKLKLTQAGSDET